MATALFLGSPKAAVPSLLAVAELTELVGVVTRPEQARGRGRGVAPTPVAEVAFDLGVPVHAPAAKGDLTTIEWGVDIVVVAAFGMIVPAALLVIPRCGFVNVHFSLLPRWRGAAPVERAILAGDERTGVCLMQMDSGLDTGPILGCGERNIDRHDAGTLTDLLADVGASLLRAELPGVLAGEGVARPQVGVPSYAQKLRAEEGVLTVGASAADLDRRIRAFTPRPGAWFETDRGRLKVWSAVPVSDELAAGEWSVTAGRVMVGTAAGVLRLLEVQPEGGRRMEAAAWANGLRGDAPTLRT